MIERLVQAGRLQGVGDVQEGVVGHREGHARRRQLPRQPGMTVDVDLQRKRRPGRHAHVAQAERFIDEVEGVIQALARGRFEQGVARGLLEPGPVGGAGLQGGEAVDQAGVVSTRGEDCLDPVLLAKRLVAADQLDGNAGLARQMFGVCPQRLVQGLRALGVVKQADTLVAERPRHGRAPVITTRSKHESTPEISL